MNCEHCATAVEYLVVELDGSLHTCPPQYLGRPRRKLVDETWWAGMQEFEQAFESEVDATPAPRVTRLETVEPTSAGGFIDG